jgi:predicted small integral membrane protein
MTIRLSKALLLLAMAFFYTLVVFNNINDYNSNLSFVRHILSMDTTFPGNNGLWRSIQSPAVHWVFFISIVCWEALTCTLLYVGGIQLLRHLRSPAVTFNSAKKIGVVALTLSLLMWLTAFLSVGAEWFLMWQSKDWNGQTAASRMFNVAGIILLYVVMPDLDGQA